MHSSHCGVPQGSVLGSVLWSTSGLLTSFFQVLRSILRLFPCYPFNFVFQFCFVPQVTVEGPVVVPFIFNGGTHAFIILLNTSRLCPRSCIVL